MELYPLLQSQLGVFYDCMKYPQVMQYNIPCIVPLTDDLDLDRVEAALQTIFAARKELKTRFLIDENGEPRQYVDEGKKLTVVRREMSEADFRDYANHGFCRPFDIMGDEPLIRAELVTVPEKNYLLVDIHHMVTDGTSYLTLFPQRDLPLAWEGKPLPVQEYGMLEAAADEYARLGDEEYQLAKSVMKEKYAGMDLATLSSHPENPVGEMGQESAYISRPMVDGWCQEHGFAPYQIFQAAFSYVLARILREDKVAYTTIYHGRRDPRVREAYGMFVRTIPFMMEIQKEQTVREYIASVHSEMKATLSQLAYPFSHFCRDLGVQPGISFNFTALPGWEEEYHFSDKHCPFVQQDRGDVFYDMLAHIFIVGAEVAGDATGGDEYYDIRMESSLAMNSRKTMRMMADAIKSTMEQMMARLDEPINSVSIVSDVEAERIIKIGTGKDIEVDLSKTFANLFTEQARRTPDAPAVVDKDSQLTYGEMDNYSNMLAHQLIEFGVRPDDFVCVMLDRTKEFPLSVLAIHKAGAAYTPLDFEYPNERLSYMLENSESKVLITSHEVLAAKQAEGNLDTAQARTFFIDDFMAMVSDASPVGAIDLSHPDGLAYMIYTSGSTGKPKGAMLHQAGLRNFIAVVIDMERLTAADRISGHRSFSFDAHIEDMYPVLTLGGSFHIMPTEIRKDLNAIRQFLIDHQITGGGYSTAMTCLLLNTFDDLPIRFTTGGGEKMDGVYSDHVEIINVYGPTECTDDTSYYSIPPGQRIENIPIGESVANNWNFIVDTAGNLVPQGVAGELCFAGVQVGRGYWRLPERTAKSFVDCPFVQHDRWGRPVRMYHTGDLCRWNEQGQIEYMGRIDTQVKLRGFRIELGEIESKALNINGIRQAAAEVRKVMGNEHLVLYYTVVEGSDIDDEALRAALAASSLAEYMVPDTYMRLDAMPMTPNGKINRKVLPMPELKRSIDYVAPEGETEQLFVRIFSEVLGIEQVGALDDFFEIGGTSLNAIKVIVEASKHGVQIVFNDLFNQKTPRALAALVKEKHEERDESPAKSSESSVKADETATPADPQLSSINAQLKRNNLQAFLDGDRQPVGDVLLTGATGYLGMHILNELLTTHDGHIYCPLRIHGGEDPMRRLKTMFFYYFGDTEAFKRLDERVSPFAAEVTQPGALDSLDCRGLTVVNCVANVKHFSAGNDIELVNIESVRHLIAFCLRTGSRLIHISTTSIAGLSVDGVPGPDVKLTEQDLWLGQNIDANKYVYSKFKAEELVLDAIFHHGLNAKIMRVGNLSARQKDGEFQINFNTNNFLALLRAYVIIGMVPYDALSQTFEFSPIDDVAHAIMLLATSPKDCTVFHPYNIHHPYFADILNGFADAGITLKRVEREEFQEALERMMDNPDLVTLLRPLMAYNLSTTHQMRWIETENDYTTQVLFRYGFQWPTTNRNYVHRFVDTITGFDYFNS
ncbi:MAG: amino acid adenylation domain-containing protein [Muribaculaceae bacterium]|nr:amino acid adenylation domain-containing protein [Muribaculaceae bacterium]